MDSETLIAIAFAFLGALVGVVAALGWISKWLDKQLGRF